MDALKRQAAARALEEVRDGMKLGLGTGSTAKHFVELLGEKVRSGMKVIGVPTSEATRADAIRCGIPLTTLDEIDHLDLTIDGADEVDPRLNMIKGHGGALLREKVVAQASRREIIVVDDSKPSPQLGTKMSLPVEVLQFAATVERAYLESLGATVTLRGGDATPFVTDEGNWIYDCDFGPIDDCERLSTQLHERAAIVEHGLFLSLATDLVIATDHGVELQSRS